jgi:hypothetical protein
VHTLDLLFRAAIPVVIIVAALVLLAYQFELVREALRQFTRFIESILCDLATAIDRIGAAITNCVGTCTRMLTHDGRFPLPVVIIAVMVTAPILALIVIVEVRLWAGYFESLFPENIQVPLVGVVAAGVLTALLPVAAGFLLGWLVEAMLGALPLPVLGGAIGPSGSPRLRGVLAFALLAFWALLVVTVADGANEVYDGLGESTCALRAAGDLGAGAPVVDATTPVLSAGPDSGAAQASCVAAWKADDQARSIRVILAELALHLSALFAWAVVAGAGLMMLLVLCIPVVGLALAAAATRLCARVALGISGVVEMLIGLARAAGAFFVRLLRWAGVPVPPIASVPSTYALALLAERAAACDCSMCSPSETMRLRGRSAQEATASAAIEPVATR